MSGHKRAFESGFAFFFKFYNKGHPLRKNSKSEFYIRKIPIIILFKKIKFVIKYLSKFYKNIKNTSKLIIMKIQNWFDLFSRFSVLHFSTYVIIFIEIAIIAAISVFIGRNFCTWFATALIFVVIYTAPVASVVVKVEKIIGLKNIKNVNARMYVY